MLEHMLSRQTMARAMKALLMKIGSPSQQIMQVTLDSMPDEH
jgi:hypothetical protein